MDIKKILIANRGEIALRAIKTANKMGISSVAVYALDDRELAYCQEATQSVYLGHGPLKETYLNQEKLIKIAKEYDCDAIYPGYGFLSENANFARLVEESSLVFIGPSAEVITLMGDKKDSKQKMQEIGVPLIPGYHGDEQDENMLLEEAKKIGFPVLIKASAGGGGKGMRIVHSKDEFLEALKSAKREALNAFSDDKVLIEKYILSPRHIEVQVVSDGQGSHYHFYERECSIQRRYQKIIEETPAYGMDKKTRNEICQCALDIAKAINYLGAGTVEFIMDESQKFYFLEMNTRLQVEHPITEMITGYDLVELQIKAAMGERFGFSQRDIKQNGHALECRIYAEDPDNDFLPTQGTIRKVRHNLYNDYRFDSSIVDGNKSSLNYDPMLAKVVWHADDRDECIHKMHEALEDCVFAGRKTNRSYLKRILSHQKFINGPYTTSFIENEKESLKKDNFSQWQLAPYFAAAVLYKKHRQNEDFKGSFESTIHHEAKKVRLYVDLNTESITLYFNQQEMTFFYKRERDKIDLLVGEFWQRCYEYPSFTNNYHYFLGAMSVDLYIEDKSEYKLEATMSEGSLTSPMPGKIFQVIQSEGASVKKGDPIMIMEAMKMEHPIKANKDGVIKKIMYQTGDQVNAGVQLVEIE